jgi:hypothetical protein
LARRRVHLESREQPIDEIKDPLSQPGDQPTSRLRINKASQEIRHTSEIKILLGKLRAPLIGKPQGPHRQSMDKPIGEIKDPLSQLGD